MQTQIPHATGEFHGYEDPTDKLIQDILKVNQDISDDFVGYIQQWGEPWPEVHTYPTPDRGMFYDYHPRCIDYANMLVKWGLPVSASTLEYAQSFTQIIDEVTDPGWLNEWAWESNPSYHDEITFYEDHFINQ